MNSPAADRNVASAWRVSLVPKGDMQSPRSVGQRPSEKTTNDGPKMRSGDA
jgi:hypothetical protein